MKQYDVKISHAALSDMEQIYSFFHFIPQPSFLLNPFLMGL